VGSVGEVSLCAVCGGDDRGASFLEQQWGVFVTAKWCSCANVKPTYCEAHERMNTPVPFFTDKDCETKLHYPHNTPLSVAYANAKVAPLQQQLKGSRLVNGDLFTACEKLKEENEQLKNTMELVVGSVPIDVVTDRIQLTNRITKLEEELDSVSRMLVNLSANHANALQLLREARQVILPGDANDHLIVKITQALGDT
jgi:hypothetical protein